jgi:hypothetical protein
MRRSLPGGRLVPPMLGSDGFTRSASQIFLSPPHSSQATRATIFFLARPLPPPSYCNVDRSVSLKSTLYAWPQLTLIRLLRRRTSPVAEAVSRSHSSEKQDCKVSLSDSFLANFLSSFEVGSRHLGHLLSYPFAKPVVTLFVANRSPMQNYPAQVALSTSMYRRSESRGLFIKSSRTGHTLFTAR